MSKPKKPFVSNEFAQVPLPQSVADGPHTVTVTALPVVETCGGCRQWRESGQHDGQLLGNCVARPPSIVSDVTPFGPRCRYRVTAEDTPACGLAEPK